MAEEQVSPVALRMRLGFDTIEDFEKGYARLVTAKGIFLASRNPRSVDTLIRFELQTRGGDSVMLAEGKVVAIRPVDPDNDNRVPGMHVRFTRLTQESRERIQRMNAALASPEEAPEAPAVDADALPAPTPAPVGPGDPGPSTEGYDGYAETPLDLPDPEASSFKNVFVRLFGMGGGQPPPDDPFEQAVEADLPTTEGAPLEEVPELPPDIILR